MGLTRDQLDFLKAELDLDEGTIAKMNEEQWKKVQLDCLDIFIDEIMKLGPEKRISEEWDDHILIADSIADSPYSDVFE